MVVARRMGGLHLWCLSLGPAHGVVYFHILDSSSQLHNFNTETRQPNVIEPAHRYRLKGKQS